MRSALLWLLIGLPIIASVRPAFAQTTEADVYVAQAILDFDDKKYEDARIVGRDGHAGMPLDFAMVRDGERWRVWDIRMQGTSMVGGYRAQFARLLQTESYDTVIHRLRERVDALQP